MVDPETGLVIGREACLIGPGQAEPQVRQPDEPLCTPLTRTCETGLAKEIRRLAKPVIVQCLKTRKFDLHR